MIYLGGGGDVGARETDIWGPCDVAYPVRVALERVLLDPALRIVPVRPNAHDVVASCAREALHPARRRGRRSGGRCGPSGHGGRASQWLDERAGRRGGRPGDGVAANAVRVEDVRSPMTVVCRGPGQRAL